MAAVGIHVHEWSVGHSRTSSHVLHISTDTEPEKIFKTGFSPGFSIGAVRLENCAVHFVSNCNVYVICSLPALHMSHQHLVYLQQLFRNTIEYG